MSLHKWRLRSVLGVIIINMGIFLSLIITVYSVHVYQDCERNLMFQYIL